MNANTPATRQRYPTGLFFLFITEMWERFSFYGISAILVLYLTKQMGVSDKEASLTSGAYMAFTFMTPILGGLIADRFLGLSRSVIVGGVLILLGNLVLALGGALVYVFLGLSLIALGTGYLKATVSVMVGKLYSPGDTHRDSGYTLFYMGINLGALLAGILVAWVGEKYGWTKGFYLSSVGMALGLVAFVTGKHYYNNEEDGYKPGKLALSTWGIPNILLISLGTILLGILMTYLFKHSGQTKIVITVLSFLILVGILILAARSENPAERKAIYAILIIIVAAICFQSFFKQLYNSVPLFADRGFDRRLMSWVSPTGMFGSISKWEIPAASIALVPNSLAVILLAGIFSWMWAKLADVGRNPSIPMKIVIALCFAVASAALLAFVAHQIGTSGTKVSAWWVILAITILTLGELNILPMGLSAVSALAPKRYASLLMGSWFLCSSLGGYFSGQLSSLVNIKKEELTDTALVGQTYFGLYWKCAAGLTVITVLMLMITPAVKRLMTAKK